MSMASTSGVWRAGRTPEGPATQHLAIDGDEVRCEAWGPGADWALQQLPDLLGQSDLGHDDFVPDLPILRASWRRYPGWRVPRTGQVLESLVPTVLEQKVTGAEAKRSWRTLVVRFGEPAPGPTDQFPRPLWLPPAAEAWRRIPTWEWHRAGVGPERARTIVGAVGRAASLERTLALPLTQVDEALRALPGVGAWTAAEVRQRAHGDPDAVSVGDFHLAGQVVFALTGAMNGDDAAMLELLEPYAGHRYRVVRMIELSEVQRPRRGPRYAPLDHRAR